MLIDSRNRLEGELKQLAFLKRRASDLHDSVFAQIEALEAGVERLALLKRSASDLHESVFAKFQELDKGLAEVSERFEPERIRKVRSIRTTARGQYGQLTRVIFGALKASGGAPLTTAQVFDYVVALWPAGSARPTDDPKFLIHMRQRLRGLRARGIVLLTCPPATVPGQWNRIRATERKRDAQEQVHGRADHRIHPAG